MDQINTFDNKVADILRYIEKPTFVKGMVYLCLMLYAARIAPVPPKAVLQLFENVYFKLFVFSLILWTAQISPSTSILIALAFMVTINYTTTGKIWEMLDNVQSTPNTTMTPTAPTQAIAMQAAATVMADQTASTQVVNNVAQNPNTLVITPSIVQTPQGPTVVNPSVVIGSAVVTSPSGQQVVVTPTVTSVTAVAPDTPVATPATTVTPAQSAQAVVTLSQAAASPAASDAAVVNSVASIAAANVTTNAGMTAVQQLSQQAVTPVSGTPEKVQAATQTALASIPVQSGPSPADSSAAIVTLAKAAASPAPSDATTVNNVASVALANASTQASATAIQQLADQAVSGAGDAKKVDAAKQTALAGCYRLRNYDMTKVSPSIDGKYSFEDYQTFTASK
jgi:hypothetical protein